MTTLHVRRSFDLEIRKLDEEQNRKLKEAYSNAVEYFVHVMPHHWVLPNKYEKFCESYYNFRAKKEEVIVMGYPRSGTTILHTLAWLLKNDLDYESAATRPFEEKAIFLELEMIRSELPLEAWAETQDPELRRLHEILTNYQEFVENRPEGAIVKTHLPVSLLPPQLLWSKCKLIYICRDPRDVIVSNYNFDKSNGFRPFKGSLEDYFDLFEKDLVPYAPYFDHLNAAWMMRNNNNVLYMTYEELIRDPVRSIKIVATLLDRDLTEQDLDGLVDHMKFENYRNSDVPSQIEKACRSAGVWKSDEDGSSAVAGSGKAGRWEELSPELRERVEKWIAREKRRTGLDLPNFTKPRTTLMEEMVWLIINDIDIERGKAVHCFSRIAYFEANLEVNEELLASERYQPGGVMYDRKKIFQLRLNTLEKLGRMKERRVIKTHLHFSLLPEEIFSKGCKVIYVARNPKDTAVSYFNLQKRVLLGTFEQYFDCYMTGFVVWNPYWDHIEQAWAKRDLPNFRFFFYEDYTRDLKKTVTEVAEFLEEPLTEEQIETLAALLSFDNFKKFREQTLGDKVSNSDADFIRKGKVGGSRDFFDSKMAEEADKWIESNSRRIGIQYPEC